MRLRIQPPPTTPISRRGRQVARWFGVNQTQAHPPLHLDLPDLRGGQILLVQGPSGSGKSSLLRAIQHHWPGTWVDLNSVALPRRCVVDCLSDRPLTEILQRLAQVGLAEVWTYLKRPPELSQGQRWRLRLARALVGSEQRAIGRAPPTALACDEFGATLDRVTAKVVARLLSRTIRQSPHLRGIFATSHDDLVEALRPDWIVKCDFGKVFVTQQGECDEPLGVSRRDRDRTGISAGL